MTDRTRVPNRQFFEESRELTEAEKMRKVLKERQQRKTLLSLYSAGITWNVQKGHQ